MAAGMQGRSCLWARALLPACYAPKNLGGQECPRHTCYCTISLIVPARLPCVRLPRMANRRPFSIATGGDQSITRLTLSPGITISVPDGNSLLRSVRRLQIKLRTVAFEERRKVCHFFFRQDVDLSLELGVRRDRSTFATPFRAPHLLSPMPTQQ